MEIDVSEYSDLVKRLRTEWYDGEIDCEAADVIELLQRELKCANELWEQQKELALEYLADIEKANERIAELEAALKPFALGGTAIEAGHNAASDDYPLMQVVSCGDLRQARKVLGEEE